MKKGFTVIELIISISVIVIVAAITATAFPRFRNSIIFNGALEDGVSLLGEARSKTLSSQSESRYGVHFASSTITIFKGASYNPLDSANRSVFLPGEVEISCIALSGGASSVVFRRLTGDADAYGIITFRLAADPNTARTLVVPASGNSYIYKEPADLLGYWNFDEGGGNVAYDRGKGKNNGTIVNITSPYGWANGKICGGMFFDGADDYVAVSAGGVLDLVGDMTISLWVKPSVGSFNFHSSWNYFIWHKDPNQSGTTKYELGYYDIDGPRFKPYNQAGANFDFSPDVLFSADMWYHVAYRRKGSLLEIYVDGARVDSRNDFSGDLRLAGNGGEVRIGGEGNFSGFIGTIDEVRIYDRALEMNEIQSLYTIGI